MRAERTESRTLATTCWSVRVSDRKAGKPEEIGNQPKNGKIHHLSTERNFSFETRRTKYSKVKFEKEIHGLGTGRPQKLDTESSRDLAISSMDTRSNYWIDL